MTRLLLILLLGLAALATASPARAAESFTGVMVDGRAVSFDDESIPGLSAPRRIAGVAAGDRIVALSSDLALGRSGTLYVFDRQALRVSPTTARMRLTGKWFSLIADREGRFAQVVSDTGQHFLVDRANFSVTPGPGLRLTDGTLIRPAATLLPDGRIVGVEPARGTLVTETAPGSGAFTEVPVKNSREARLQYESPLALSVAGGRGYLVSGLPGARRFKQSRLIRIDLATGRTTGESGPYFFRQFAALVPGGTAPIDTAAPRITWVSYPRTVRLRDLARDGGVRFRVRCSEACSLVGSSGVGGRSNFGVGITRDMPGTVEIRLARHFERELRLLRFRLGKTIKLRVFARDFAGNTQTYDRNVRLVR